MTRSRWMVALACASLFANCTGTVTSPTPTGTTPPTTAPGPTGTINSPGGAINRPTIEVSGTYTGNASSAVWLVVIPDLASNVAFPQSSDPRAGAPAIRSGGTWRVNATFGGPPQDYTIAVYEATNSAASEIFAQNVRAGSTGLALTATNGYTTIPGAAQGANRLAAIRVTRGPLAEILDPGGGAEFTRGEITVSGRYAEGLNDSIWILVWPRLAPGLGYPQSPNASQGLPAAKDPLRLTWTVPVTLGGDPQEYDIRVYYADASASNFLGATLRDWVARNSYPGLRVEDLPQGLHEQMKITIRKR
jgi:hypothetical protein